MVYFPNSVVKPRELSDEFIKINKIDEKKKVFICYINVDDINK